MLLKMKFSLLLLLIGILQVSAVSYSQATLLTVDARGKQVAQVLREIEEKSDFRFFYQREQVDVEREVMINLEDKTVDEVMDLLFAGENVSHKIYADKLILIAPTEMIDEEAAPAVQENTVTGSVKDEEGNSLPGVSIRIKGTTRGTVTDLEGNFYLVVGGSSDILVFSYVGYISHEITVGNQAQMDVVMESDVLGIDEVVVVGYGSIGKKELTGSVGHLNMTEIDNKTFASIDRAIQGKIPGVTVQTDGSPGGRVDIRVRGLGTITNNEPLLVVDGVPVGSLNNIDPSIIQSVDVLKDASATAIYGNRASNGVILIRTKKGQANQKAQIQASYQFGVATMGKKIDLLNADQYRDIMNEAVDNAVAQGIITEGSISDEITNFVPEDNDWQDAISQTGLSHVGSISGMGGSDRISYYLSGSFRTIDGTIKTSKQNRVNLTANTEMFLTKWLTFGENVTFMYEDFHNVSTHAASGWGGIILSAAEAAPQIPLNANDGPGLGAIGTEVSFYGNQYPMRSVQGENITSGLRTFGNTYLNFNIFKGLEFKTQLGFNYFMSGNHAFSPYRYYPEPEIDSDIRETSNMGQTILWDNFLTYDAELGESSLNIMLGSSIQKSKGRSYNASRIALVNEDPAFRFLDFGDPTVTTNGGTGSNSSLQSFFARVNYDYKDRYLVTATMRADGSSKFMVDNRWGYFPSIGLGWNITEEEFMSGVSGIDFMKLRGSWGQVGNQSLGSNYPYLDIIEPQQSNYVLGPGDGSVVSGTAESARGNRDITWETTTMLNIGLDVSLFGKLSLTAEYFNNNTQDLLLPVQLADLGGRAAPPYVNVGTVNATGFEASIDYYILKNSNWNVSVGLNGTYLKNEVTDLGETEFLIGTAAFNRIILPSNSPLRTAVGYPISSYYGYEMEGIFQTPDEVSNSPTQEDNTAPGDIKWVDQNGDNVINADDRVFLGDGFPDFVYGFNIFVGYKDFDFSITAHGALGVQIYNALRMDLMSSLPVNKHVDILDRWTGEGTSTTVPRVVYNDPAHNVRGSDYFIEKGDYLRLSTIQLGYSLPGNVAKRLKLSSLRAYVTVQNLYTFTQYSGSNPEVRAASGDTFQRDLNLGWDTGVYPVPRTFMIGLDITF